MAARAPPEGLASAREAVQTDSSGRRGGKFRETPVTFVTAISGGDIIIIIDIFQCVKWTGTNWFVIKGTCIRIILMAGMTSAMIEEIKEETHKRMD